MVIKTPEQRSKPGYEPCSVGAWDVLKWRINFADLQGAEVAACRCTPERYHLASLQKKIFIMVSCLALPCKQPRHHWLDRSITVSRAVQTESQVSKTIAESSTCVPMPFSDLDDNQSKDNEVMPYAILEPG